MAKDVQIQKSVRGEPLADFIVRMKGVQAVVRDRAFEIEAEAEVQLEAHREEGNSQIRKRKINQYAWRVWLDDPIDLTANGIDRGSAAENIEEGHLPYVVRTNWRTSRGQLRFPGQLYGGMDGLHIMSRAVAIVAARHRSEFR